MSFCTRLSNFIHIGPSLVELWCYIDFQDGERWMRNFTSGFALADVPHFRRSVSRSRQTKFRSYSSIHVWVITISGLEKQTSVIFEFFFRLLLRSYHSDWRAIPHQATKCRPNLATRGGVMTLYTISRWRQRWLNTTSGFVVDVTLIRRSKSVQISSTYFNPRLDITTSGLEKQTSVILELFFPLRFLPDRSNLRAILNQVPIFRRSNDVICNFKMAAAVAQ